MLEKIKTFASEVWAVRPNKREIAIIELSQFAALLGIAAFDKEGSSWITAAILMFSFFSFAKAHKTWLRREKLKAQERYAKKLQAQRSLREDSNT